MKKNRPRCSIDRAGRVCDQQQKEVQAGLPRQRGSKTQRFSVFCSGGHHLLVLRSAATIIFNTRLEFLTPGLTCLEITAVAGERKAERAPVSVDTRGKEQRARNINDSGPLIDLNKELIARAVVFIMRLSSPKTSLGQ